MWKIFKASREIPKMKGSLGKIWTVFLAHSSPPLPRPCRSLWPLHHSLSSIRLSGIHCHQIWNWEGPRFSARTCLRGHGVSLQGVLYQNACVSAIGRAKLSVQLYSATPPSLAWFPFPFSSESSASSSESSPRPSPPPPPRPPPRPPPASSFLGTTVASLLHLWWETPLGSLPHAWTPSGTVT